MCDLANQNSTLLQHITFPSASYWNANLWLSLFGSTLCCAFVFNLCYIVLAQKNRKKRYNKENFNRFIIYMTLASLYLGWRTILVFFDIQSAIDSELASTWVLVASKLLVISVFASYSEFLSHISGILDIASFTVILAWAIVSICGSLIFTPEDVAISITWFNDYVLSAYLSIVYFGIFVAMCVFSIRIIMEMKEARKKTRQIKVLNLKIIFPFTCVPLLARSVFNILQPFTNKGGNPLDRLFCTLKQQGEWSQYFFVYTIFYTVAEIMPIIACSLFAFNILRNKDIIANLAQIPVVQRQNIPDQDVPVSLAASGGGIRSASTTAGVIGGLTSSETFTFEGVRRNLGRDLTLKIISAVSGGGFAAGAFISEQHAHQNISQETAANNIIRHMYNNSGYLINTDRWCSFWFDLMLIALLLLTWLVVFILTFLPFLILGVVVVVDICAMIDLQERKDRTLTILWVFLVCHAIHFVLLISARCLKSYWKPEQKFQSLKHGLERILVLLSVTFIGAAWTFAFIGITAAFPTTFQDDILKLAFILIIRISASLWTSMHNNLFSIGLFVMLLSELSAWKYFGLNSLFYVIELEYSQQSFGYFVFLAGAMTFGLDFVIHIRQNLLFWYYRYSIAKLLKVDPNVRDISADNTATKLISVTVANGWKKNDGEKSFALYSIATHNDRREGHTFRKDVDGNYQATATSAPLDLTLSTLLALSGSAFGYSNGLKEEEISVLGKLKWIQAIFGFGLGSWAQIEESSRAKVIITTLFHIAMAGISILLMMAGLNQYTDQEETLLVIAICICVGMVIIFFIVPMFSPKFAAYTFDIAIFRVINRLLGVNFMGADPAHLYISDGGHVENSGLVPLLYDILGDPQPQAQNVAVNAPIDHVVVVSDSSTDGKWRLSSIKYALRRVRNLYPNGEFRTINGGDFERQLSDFKYRRPTPKSMPDFEQFGEKCAKCLFEFELIANNKRIWIIVIKPPPVRDNQLEVSAEINNVRDNSCCKPSRRACCCSFCNFWCCCRDTEFPHISLTGQFFNQSRFKSYCEMGAVLGLLARMTINYRLGELHKNNNNNNGCHHPDDSHDNDNDNGDEEALLP